MSKRRLRSVREIIYRDGPTMAGERAFSEIQSDEENDEEFLTTSTTIIPLCAGCGKVIHDPSEGGGFCSVAMEKVCVVCERNMRCELCTLIVCHDHARPFGDGVICSHHTYVETLLLPRRRRRHE